MSCLRIPLVLSISLLASSVLADDSVLERQRRDLETIEREVETVRRDLATQRAARAELARELQQAERDVASLARAGHQLAIEIADQESVIERLRRALADEQQALAREQRALADLLRAVYAAGPADRLKLILNQEDGHRLTRLLSYYDYINRQRRERILGTQARATRLVELAAAADEEVDRLRRLAEHQGRSQQKLEEAQTRRRALLAELEQTIAGRGERVAQLEADAETLRRLITSLEQREQIDAEADVQLVPIAQRRGQLGWPVPGRLVTRFGAPKDGGPMTWDGIVLAVPEGVPVRAVHPGRVVYADWLRGLGLLLIIDHDDGFLTLYGHNQALLKEAGEWVVAGETIALSGTTGGRDAVGLYFALRHQGRPVNPEQWLAARAH